MISLICSLALLKRNLFIVNLFTISSTWFGLSSVSVTIIADLRTVTIIVHFQGWRLRLLLFLFFLCVFQSFLPSLLFLKFLLFWDFVFLSNFLQIYGNLKKYCSSTSPLFLEEFWLIFPFFFTFFFSHNSINL